MDKREYLGLGFAPGDKVNQYHMIRGDSGPNEIYYLTAEGDLIYHLLDKFQGNN